MTTPLTPEDVQANLDTLKTQIPTLEELMFSTCLATWNGDQMIGYSYVATLMVAPIAMRVLGVGLVWDYFNQPVSDTNYWKAILRKGDEPTGYDILATRATTNTGEISNGPIVARKAWTFDAAAWNVGDLEPGDLLQINWARVGAPSDMRMPMTATVRYTPL